MAKDEMFDVSNAAVVHFPVRGEWSAVNTPAERVPSHGTDYFGQRFAYDFARFSVEGMRFYRNNPLRHILASLPASAFFCWEQPVYSAFDGIVAGVGDGWPDRVHVNALWELVRGTLLARPPLGRDYRPLAGNFVLVEGAVGVALYAHLRKGSVTVHERQKIATGSQIGAVGNSGNSTMPHLHFHLMDRADPLTAAGLPCLFRDYERFDGASWTFVERGAPARFERIRTRTL